MQASKLTLSPEMMEALARPGISRKHKQKLRVNAVKDYIRSKPTGTPMTVAELAVAAGYNSAGSGSTAINKMLEKNIIARTKDIDSFKSIWSIPGDTHTIKPADKPYGIDKDVEPSTDEHLPKGIVGTVETLYSVENIVMNAKQFAWERNSDSLRDFIASLQ